MRAVLDVNVLASALLSRSGTPAKLVRAWLDGSYELIVSASLLDELERTLAYPKVAKRVLPDEASEFLALLGEEAEVLADPPQASDVRSVDPDDDDLIALARMARAVLVSGDGDLLGLAGRIPVLSPREFLSLLDKQS
ncbi:MAG: putative toxin-antitoxin system toxin component, PIN family [Mycobacteriales bacterium]